MHMFPLSAACHCDYRSVGGHMLRLPSIQGAVISSYWNQWHAWSRPLFICSHRSPFLTHSTLMAPFTPVSVPCPGSTMNTSLPPCLPDRLLSVEKPTARGKAFVTYLRGGWMVSSFDLYLAIFPLTPDISLSHLSDVTKVILCPGCWIPRSPHLHKVQASGTSCKGIFIKSQSWIEEVLYRQNSHNHMHGFTSCKEQVRLY